MDNPKISEIIQKLRLREERYEAMKRNRRVSFADMCTSQEEKSEDICIFEATKIRERIEEWPNEQNQKPDVYKTILESLKNHVLDDFFKDSDEGKRIDFTPLAIRPKCFSNIYKWMLTEAIDGQPGLSEINKDTVLDMLNASKKLQIMHLEDQCWYFLKKSDENVAFELYKACHYNIKEIQQLMLSRICKYFLTLVSSEDFLKLNINEVCTLLSLNTLGVNSEIEIFYAAVLWLNYMWNERKGDNLIKVINCVRFNLMPPWFLVSLNERTGTEEVDKITALQYVSNLITDSIIFTATQLSCLTGVYKASDKKFEQITQNMPSQRRWVYDKSCGYHYGRNDANMNYVSYEMFTSYLKCLREFGKEYWRTLDFASPDHCERMWKSRPKIKSK